MKSFSLSEVDSIKMATNPPSEIMNAGFQVINIDGYIYEFDYKKLKWNKTSLALREDYQEIPEIIN